MLTSRLLTTLLLVSLSSLGPPLGADKAPLHAGSDACAACHADIHARWQPSHHALAMQPATVDTVLGRFDGTTHHFAEGSWRFELREGRHQVWTDDTPEGQATLDVSHTFGVFPLQQYLIPMPGGRRQVLPVAWDSRPEDQGGQRWFHLQEDDPAAPGSTLHWAGGTGNWNRMCAECHVTGWVKGYDPGSQSYDSRYSEGRVGCEACHGPGLLHVALARTRQMGAGSLVWQANHGFAQTRLDAAARRWRFAPGAHIAHLESSGGAAARSRDMLEPCAECHARRSRFSDTPRHDTAFLDAFEPQLPVPPAYFADGGIDDEVFEWGSFTQSRMYLAGVRCGDCHEPHSLELRATGNALCAGCHAADHYDNRKHHHHPPGSEGDQCVACHAPARTYMGVDDRRDHAFRIPRPDLALATGAPDACSQCHTDREQPQLADAWRTLWSATALPPRGGNALAATVIQGRPAAALLRIARNAGEPAVIRAAALRRLEAGGHRLETQRLEALVNDDAALVRMAAVGALQASAPEVQVALAAAALDDPVRAVRQEAARRLQQLPNPRLSRAQQSAFHAALGELHAAETYNADWPGAQLNLASMAIAGGDAATARVHGEEALSLDAHFHPARLLLAELARLGADEQRGRDLLEKGLALEPANPELAHALGLSLIRSQEYAAALPWLERAAEQAPETMQFGYIHAIAVQSRGQLADAIALMEAVHADHPGAPEPIAALAQWEAARGNRDAALAWQRRYRVLMD